MKPERCTRGIWVMAAVLGAAAVVLDDPALFLATTSLVLLSAALAIRFRVRMHAIASSAAIMRSSDHKTAHQGDTITVTTVFSCSPDPGMTLRVGDLLPASTLPGPEETTTIVAADGSATIRYSLTLLVPGSIRFPGISLTVSDVFFTASLAMESAAFCGPEPEVHPHASYARPRVREEFGEVEKNMPSAYLGYGIRSFREYVAGDDIRAIDWKMTAKHEKIFIREYTAVANLPPLIVLDLPDSAFPVADEKMAQLVNQVTSEAVAALRNFGSVSLFIISGVNVIDMALEETDLRRCSTIIRTSAHPRFRFDHAYRYKNRASMRRCIRKAGSADPWPEGDEASRLQERISRIYQRSLADPDIPVFSLQVGRLLNSLQNGDIVLFSLFIGDLSHIREIVYQAWLKKRPVKISIDNVISTLAPF